MRLVLIDTSAWLFNFPPRVVPAIRDRITELIQGNLAAVSSPVLSELLSGAGSREEMERLHRHLSGLHPVPFTTGQWIQAARWTQRLRALGVRGKTVDFLIAYQAATFRLKLLHADRDFDRIAEHSSLKVESYAQSVSQGRNR